ncbi:AAA family ATPase [uncultured Demequina sp.]|uniref:AAA family ATPase n=1 Tax=uncultured Demequina sp. TaxID=693499 RepID=UPI0025D8D427|nr:AAA family ATPase [uncultured Demequina sp.]
MSAVGVIIAVSGGAESGVAAAIDAHPRLAVARRCADVAEAIGAAAAGVGGAVVLSDQPRLSRAVVAALIDTGVVLVGVAAAPEPAEQLRALGIETVAAPGWTDDEIALLVADRLAHAARRPPSRESARAERAEGQESADRDGQVIAVWGPTGAPGRTTIAVNLAAELARSGTSTLLIDADTYGGAVAQAIGMSDEVPGLAGVIREAQHGSVDAAILARHAVTAAEGLSVLTGITRAGRWTEIAPAALEEVLRAARHTADAVVIDCGFGLEADEELQYDTRAPQRNGATLTALSAADQVIAVGSAEPLGIQRLIHGLDAVRSVAAHPLVVVNRVRAQVAGPRPAEAVADVLARFAEVDRITPVPWDPAPCDAAALEGRVLAECAPRSKARRAIAGIASALALGADAGSTPRRSRALAAAVKD